MQYFHKVLFIVIDEQSFLILFSMLHESVDEFYGINIQMKPIQQYFHKVLSILIDSSTT